MKAIAEIEQEQAPEVITSYNRDTIIRMEEGLIGFSGCKDFVLMAKPEIAPFQMLKCINASDISFLVLNPKVLVPNFYDSVPEREWESIGITDKQRRLAFAISIIGRTPREGSANLQAPLLMNYEAMIARQVILTDSGFSFRHPLI